MEKLKVDVYPRDLGTAETTPDATPTPSSLELELESSRYLLAKHEEESALRSKQLVAALRDAERSRAVAVDAEARAQRLACSNDGLNAELASAREAISVAFIRFDLEMSAVQAAASAAVHHLEAEEARLSAALEASDAHNRALAARLDEQVEHIAQAEAAAAARAAAESRLRSVVLGAPLAAACTQFDRARAALAQRALLHAAIRTALRERRFPDAKAASARLDALDAAGEATGSADDVAALRAQAEALEAQLRQRAARAARVGEVELAEVVHEELDGMVAAVRALTAAENEASLI